MHGPGSDGSDVVSVSRKALHETLQTSKSLVERGQEVAENALRTASKALDMFDGAEPSLGIDSDDMSATITPNSYKAAEAELNSTPRAGSYSRFRDPALYSTPTKGSGSSYRNPLVKSPAHFIKKASEHIGSDHGSEAGDL